MGGQPGRSGISGISVQIITFDFHNTIALCDPWFELEVRTLPAAVLQRLAASNDESVCPETEERATELYRALRRNVIATGVERDAMTGVSHVLRQLGMEHSRAILDDTIDGLMRECLYDLTPVPGAIELISTLIEAGVPVGIVSSAVYHPFLEWSLERFGVLDHLAFVATSASVGHYKSVPAIYHAAYALAGADTSLGVHVGDSPRWDVDTAQQAGLATVLYEPGRQQAPVDASFAPDLVLESLVGAREPLMALLEQRKARAAV